MLPAYLNRLAKEATAKRLARYFVWDGVRALDYLTSLPEVDASRLGITGNSGGGTLTTYISMLDPRVKVSSIVTFIASLPKKIEARTLDAGPIRRRTFPGFRRQAVTTQNSRA
jgi:cephalosporin-C deacetylase-like acetyl esterase